MQRTRSQHLNDWVDHSLGFRSVTYQYHSDHKVKGDVPVVQVTSRLTPDWNKLGLPRGQQVTTDENHSFRPEYSTGKLSTLGDVGGRFWSQRKVIDVMPSSYHFDQEGLVGSTWYRNVYDGPVHAIPVTLSTPFPTYSQRDLTVLGTEAIARCKPTNNVANLAADTFEIYRDGLPRMFGATAWRNRTQLARAVGPEYLNAVFGWEPLVSDLRSACYAVQNAHRLLRGYEANSGKLVRRRYEFPLEESTTVTNMGPAEGSVFQAFNTTLLVDSHAPKPSLIKTSKFVRRTWFSGAFTYHLPIGYSSRNWLVSAAAKAGPLLGLELTPETVWAATPWTWALGWFSNVGDLVSNFSDWATDGLVLHHGYIMEHTLQTDTYELDGPTRFKPYGLVYASPVTVCVETKRREKATPFGFGLEFNDFSPRQLAIIAALGLSFAL